MRAIGIGIACLIGVTVALVGDVVVPRAAAEVTCDKVAAIGGDDANPGTLAHPYATVGRLLDGLAAGQVGCLRAGNYYGEIPDEETGRRDTKIEAVKSGITLTSYPGERARLVGRLWIAADDATVSNLDLDGVNPLPDQTSSLLIAGDAESPPDPVERVKLVNNDITNQNRFICVNLGTGGDYGRAIDAWVENNRIHDCGIYEWPPPDLATLPPPPGLENTGHWNEDHGIYVGVADGTNITGNLIYDNASRGIQLVPDAQGTEIWENVVDNNGVGILIGGDKTEISSGNVVRNNVISWASERFNVEWTSPCVPNPQPPLGCAPEAWPASGNDVHDNCLVANSRRLDYFVGGLDQQGWRDYHNTNFGVLDPDTPGVPYDLALSENFTFPLADELYVDRLGKDFRLDSSACPTAIGSDPADGLARWTAVQPIPEGNHDAIDPVSSIGADGTQALAWIDTFSGVQSVHASVLVPKTPSMESPNGAQWDDTQLNASGNPAAQPTIGVDAQGNAIAVWRELDGGVWRVYTSTRAALTGTWSAPQVLTPAGVDTTGLDLAVADDGSAVASWTRTDVAPARIQTRFRATTGTWAPITRLSQVDPASDSQVAISASGKAYAVWREEESTDVIYANVRPTGGDWAATPTLLSNAASNADQPEVDAGSAGDAVAVWRRVGATSVIQAASTTGTSWSSASSISNAAQNAEHPRVGVAADGAAVAAWRRFSGVKWIGEANLRPSGGSFAANGTKLTPNGQDATEIEVAVGDDGTAVMTWVRFDPGSDHERVQMVELRDGVWGTVSTASTAGSSDGPSGAPLLFPTTQPTIAVGPHGHGLAAWAQGCSCSTGHRIQFVEYHP